MFDKLNYYKSFNSRKYFSVIAFILFFAFIGVSFMVLFFSGLGYLLGFITFVSIKYYLVFFALVEVVLFLIGIVPVLFIYDEAVYGDKE